MGGGSKGSSPPKLQAPREVPLSETFGKFLGQEAQLPALSSFADSLNEQFRQTLETGLPGTIGVAKQSQKLVSDMLSGVPSAETQAGVSRFAAENALATGLQPTSQASQYAAARSYGTTSMALQQQGLAGAQGIMALSDFLSPQQAQNYLFSTGQIRGEDVKAAQDQANVANQNAMNKYQYDQQQGASGGNSGLFGTLGGLGGGALGSFLMPGAGTGIGGMLGSGLGSAMGGGGFSPGAGQSGGAMSSMSQMGSSLFGGGLMGGGGGSSGLLSNSATAGASYPGPFMSMPTSMVSSYLTPSSMGQYGGSGQTGVKMF